MQAKQIELDQGSTIDGVLKIATQFAKGNIILRDKENFQKNVIRSGDGWIK